CGRSGRWRSPSPPPRSDPRSTPLMPHDVLARHALAGGLDEFSPPRAFLYLQLQGDPDEHEWALRSFVLDERLHAPYALAVKATGPMPKAGVDGLLGGRVVLELARG